MHSVIGRVGGQGHFMRCGFACGLGGLLRWGKPEDTFELKVSTIQFQWGFPMNRRIVGGIVTIAIVVALTGAVAGPASAVSSITSYCQSHLYHNPDGHATGQPTKAVQCELQVGPATAGGYNGPGDGALGPNSWKGLQQFLKNNGWYSGPVDGAPGPNTYNGLIKWGNYSGPVNGIRPLDGSLDDADWQNVADAMWAWFYSD